jgi:hypothetical protein
MGFASGSISFRRFQVVGNDAPAGVDQSLLDKLAEHLLRPEPELPQDVEYGWSGGQHIYDNQLSFDRNVFNDALTFALRVDINKVPSSVKKAYEAIEEQAVAQNNPSGFISRQQKKAVKELVAAKLHEEVRTGKFRRIKLLPILWDVPAQMLYSTATGTAFEQLSELFERTFNLQLQPVTAGSRALQRLEAKGKRRDYEDFRPARFVIGPDGEGAFPEYPWTAKGAQAKDFLGNEFLLWLWFEADAREGVIKTGESRDTTIFFDRSLELSCAYGQTGHDLIRSVGPSRSPEARDALRVGKVPRKAGMLIEGMGQQFNLNLAAESLSVTAARLPAIEEADTPRKAFEERIGQLRDLGQTIDGLYEAFLKVRASSAWESQCSSIRKWILQSAPQPMVAVA